MNPRLLVLLAAGGSLALLLGAWGFQYLGYAPCKLCIWQRWPHGVAVGAGALALVLGPLVIWAGVGALAALTTAGIGIYHSGVELKWWAGPSGCTGGGSDLGSMSGSDLLSMDGPTGIVMCDEVAWAFAGLSMASWNAVLSLCLAAIWIQALRAQTPGR